MLNNYHVTAIPEHEKSKGFFNPIEVKNGFNVARNKNSPIAKPKIILNVFGKYKKSIFLKVQINFILPMFCFNTPIQIS